MASGLEKYLNDLEKRLNATGVEAGFFPDSSYAYCRHSSTFTHDG